MRVGDWSWAARSAGVARTLKFPERFFLGDDIGELAPEAASFRSLSKRTARQRDMALGSAAVAVAFNQAIERLYAQPEVEFPRLRAQIAPEEAAEAVQQHWGLGEKPIESMVQLLEAKGARAFSLPADAVEADTFSMWHRDQPFVLLNTAKGRDEQRVDLALEFGHLLLHRHGPPAGPKAQQAAGVFAAAFLMPAAAMRAAAPHPPAIDQVIALARKWRAPPAAIAQRLHRLGLLSDWQYRMLRGEISAQGEPYEEAPDAHRETSLLLQRVFASLRSRGITKHKIASTLRVYPKDIDEMTFRLFGDAVVSDAKLGRLRLTLVSSERSDGHGAKACNAVENNVLAQEVRPR